MADIVMPNFRYSGLYYPEILQDLLLWRRVNLPEMNDEDPNEPLVQLLRAFALVGHLSNVLADHVATETLLPTARLRESVRGHLALIGYVLSQPVPAIVEVVARLPAAPTVASTLPARSRFANTGTDTTPEVVFETAADLVLSAGNAMSAAWEYLASFNDYTDRTADFNAAGTPVSLWTGSSHAGDMLYFGHDSIMFGRVDVLHGVLGTAITRAWEYYDGAMDDTTPSAVTDLGTGLKLRLTSLLGAANRAGATVRVRCNLTGLYEEAASTWDGTYNVVTVGYLGQTGASTTVTDYLIGCLWKELPDCVETLGGDAVTVTLGYTLPEALTRRWTRVAVNGSAACYWVRLRCITGGATAPSIDSVRIDLGSQYLKVAAAQGETIFETPAASSSGLASQRFVTGRDDVVQGTMVVAVDEGGGPLAWSLVQDFLSSTSTSRDYTLAFDEDGRAVVVFGNGTQGKIPMAGVNNIGFTYRRGAAANGNVGAGTVTINRASTALVASCTNPRPGFGWAEAEGASDAGLARLKIAGPASLRTLQRVVTGADAEALAPAWKAADGSAPIKRAKAVEEMFGPKTLGLLAVGDSGAAVPSEYLTELGVYLNGDPVANTSGVMLLNTQAYLQNFVPHPIAVTATVYGAVTVGEVQAALRAFLSPVALDDLGDWAHQFGGTVYRERLVAIIFASKPGRVRNVVLTTPAGDTALASTELPTCGTLTITVVP